MFVFEKIIADSHRPGPSFDVVIVSFMPGRNFISGLCRPSLFSSDVQATYLLLNARRFAASRLGRS